jgi:hypothetical protein
VSQKIYTENILHTNPRECGNDFISGRNKSNGFVLFSFKEKIFSQYKAGRSRVQVPMRWIF